MLWLLKLHLFCFDMRDPLCCLGVKTWLQEGARSVSLNHSNSHPPLVSRAWFQVAFSLIFAPVSPWNIPASFTLSVSPLSLSLCLYLSSMEAWSLVG